MGTVSEFRRAAEKIQRDKFIELFSLAEVHGAYGLIMSEIPGEDMGFTAGLIATKSVDSFHVSFHGEWDSQSIRCNTSDPEEAADKTLTYLTFKDEEYWAAVEELSKTVPDFMGEWDKASMVLVDLEEFIEKVVRCH